MGTCLYRISALFFIATACTVWALSFPVIQPGSSIRLENKTFSSDNEIRQHSDTLLTLAYQLRIAISRGKQKDADMIAGILKKKIDSGAYSSEEKIIYPLSILGAYYITYKMPLKSFPYFEMAFSLLDKYPSDSIYTRLSYNMAVAYNRIGDDFRAVQHALTGLDYLKKTKGSTSSELVIDYLSLAIHYINLRNPELAIMYASKGIAIAEMKPDSVSSYYKASLYQTKGTALANMSEYHQAVLNFTRAKRIYETNKLVVYENYINLLDNLADSYLKLGNRDKALDAFRLGCELFLNHGSRESYNLIMNYAYFLAGANLAEKGEELVNQALASLKKNSDPDSRDFVYAAVRHADFLNQYGKDREAPQRILSGLSDYAINHPWDKNLNTSIALGYSDVLVKNGNAEAALDSVNSIIEREAGTGKTIRNYEMPHDTLLRADKRTLEILQARFNILRQISLRKRDSVYLLGVARTSESIVRIIDRMRLEIGEEQSRLLLGDRFRSAYINHISSLFSLYSQTGRPEWLEKAVEYSEKSKAATLVASMREMKALLHSVPEEVSERERKIYEEVSFYRAKYDEVVSSDQDEETLKFWEERLLSAGNRRDSLMDKIDKSYPDYYRLKYDDAPFHIDDIRKLIGRNRDYISYIVSDTIIYIVHVNRKNIHLATINAGDDFPGLVSGFRKLISEPDLYDRAREEYIQFQLTGQRLYNLLVAPVREFITSSNLVISPDNILAFFPFETLVTTNILKDDLYYSGLDYLMNEFRISYAYSARLLTLTESSNPVFRNRVAAFAPRYPESIYPDSLSDLRQLSHGRLSSLPYALDEASYVSDLTGGDLFEGDSITKDLFRNVAGDYDILHLAMHTVLNGRNPLSSGMIFSGADSIRYLRPYEIYTLPLNARMVVLSSCFTGAGDLYAGEGILSIARGFIFSGSKSVVMSLWEVDDKSGTEIIKDFYRQIKWGREKSVALRNARLRFLENSDMLHSHPFYWSTLVVYGDDSSLYVPGYMKIFAAIFAILVILYFYSYLRKR